LASSVRIARGLGNWTLGRSLNLRAPIERNLTTREIDALRTEVDTLKRRLAAIERLFRFAHGDSCLGGSGPPPQPRPQPELVAPRLRSVATLPLATTK
jgi:hypothetical protein